MSKKVLILSGSPRKGGNSDLLCGEFARGAQENGNEVEIIRVAAKKIAPCSGCYYCRAHNGECAHKDDMAEVLQKMIDADVIVMASPVYFYSIDAQLKAVIDRTVARWLEVKNKDFYYVVTMADEDVSSADTTLACLRGYAACVRGAQEKGVIIGSGVYEPGKVKDKPAMQQAYRFYGRVQNGGLSGRRLYFVFQGAAPEKWMLEAGEYTMKRFAVLYGMSYEGMATDKAEAERLNKTL